MKTLTLLSAAITTCLGLAACGNSTPSIAASANPQVAASDSVATVNGKAISKRSLEILRQEAQRRSNGAPPPDEKLIDELVSRELLKQEAEAKQLASQPDAAAKIEYNQRFTLAQIAAEDFMKKADVSDADLKTEYDARVAQMNTTEYKARHILVDSDKEALAKTIITQLKKAKGPAEVEKKFNELAKQHSKDTSGKEGGDLGWFAPQQMVQPFSDAVVALKDGEFTATPVQTQFGWHVILREQTRKQEAPPFDKVKEQLKQMTASKRLIDHIAQLRGKAQVVIPERKDATPKGADSGKDGSMESTNAPSEGK